jgi:hypothetical protein
VLQESIVEDRRRACVGVVDRGRRAVGGRIKRRQLSCGRSNVKELRLGVCSVFRNIPILDKNFQTRDAHVAR